MKNNGFFLLVFILNLISIFAFSQNIIWTKKADSPVPISKVKAAFVNGKIYLFGGTTPQSNGFSRTNYVYDPASDTWSRKKDIPTGRINYALAVILGKIYVIGGDPFLNIVEVFDPKSDTWDSVTRMPTGRQHVSCAVADNKIYVIGGLENVCCPSFPERCDWEKCTKISDKNEVFDPATGYWKTLKSMPSPRHGLDLVTVNGKIYAIGGMGNKTSMWYPLNKVEEYDPATDIWTAKGEMPSPRDGFGYSVKNNSIYLFGGWVTDQKQTVSTIIYNTKTDIWTPANNLPVKTGAFAYVTAGDKIYFFGGDKEDYSEIYSFNYEGVILK
jgi:N-acetylneuraminic acid mutarotase